MYRYGVLRKFLFGRIEYTLFTWFNPIRAGVITFLGLIYCWWGKFQYPVDWFVVSVVGFYSVSGYHILSTWEADDRRYKVLAIYQYVVVFILLIYLGMPSGSLFNWVFGPPAQCMEQFPTKPVDPVNKSFTRQLVGDLYNYQLASRHGTLANHILETKNVHLQTASKLLAKDEPVKGMVGTATTCYLVIRAGQAALCNKFGACTSFGPLSQMKEAVAVLQDDKSTKIVSRKTATKLGLFKKESHVEELIFEPGAKLTEAQFQTKLDKIAELKGILKNVQPSGWRMRAMTCGIEVVRVVAAGTITLEIGAVATEVVSKLNTVQSAPPLIPESPLVSNSSSPKKK